MPRVAASSADGFDIGEPERQTIQWDCAWRLRLVEYACRLGAILTWLRTWPIFSRGMPAAALPVEAVRRRSWPRKSVFSR